MKPIIAVPVTLAMAYRAWTHKSLTPLGIVAAVLTAIAHAVHPWNLPFALLIVFFLAGTKVTKVSMQNPFGQDTLLTVPVQTRRQGETYYPVNRQLRG
jgi:uncharacterized membrane protein